ncbi:UBP-type zinc finger domain-containing protein [Hymenobacter sp. BT635]|uniref:UBP-type zinc finger domain-containing protein n=1 Tax=Hymenobacter nitidus TaxID=2880929 RepID=A0ABS8AF37_9BACT|nr:UBP-type zinc finger domain-containing protein [Hymenobacter nitidus]MCB2378064.1 UBP-type zinc finger domain-containing protein [Hymenobacter nitidus]
MALCEHLAALETLILAADYSCAECVALSDTWVHLRVCQSCGHVGCCDSSPNRHATKHFRATQHPVVLSAEPGEQWAWCYADNQLAEY